MALIQRAWRIEEDPFVNQGGKITVTGHAGLPPDVVLNLDRRLAAGEYQVAIERVTDDVEDEDRNVVTEPDRTYRVISNGNEHYLIQTA
jgi:hypothetical protein